MARKVIWWTYSDGGVDDLNIAFLDQYLASLEAKLFDLFFSYRFATQKLFNLTMRYVWLVETH